MKLTLFYIWCINLYIWLCFSLASIASADSSEKDISCNHSSNPEHHKVHSNKDVTKPSGATSKTSQHDDNSQCDKDVLKDSCRPKWELGPTLEEYIANRLESSARGEHDKGWTYPNTAAHGASHQICLEAHGYVIFTCQISFEPCP